MAAALVIAVPGCCHFARRCCSGVDEDEAKRLEDRQAEVDRVFANELRTDPAPPRECRGDSYFIEVPLTVAQTPWTDDAFLARVEDDLTTRARYAREAWFCKPGDCPEAFDIRVEVESLLPRASYHPLRRDGHLRFFRARFLGRAGRVLTVNKDYQCEVVSAVRGHFVDRALPTTKERASALRTFPSDLIRVGRECDALPTSDEAYTGARKNWHWTALESGDPNASPRADPLPGADIALIDSGVRVSTATTVGINLSRENIPGALIPDPDAPAGLHLHGTAMAKLMRTVTPAARIYSYRAIDVYGVGTTEGLAKALDRAIADAVVMPVVGTSTTPRPRIINLSLGWTPSKGRDSLIKGLTADEATCRTVEHGLGESVRYLLYLARQIDRSGRRRDPRLTVVSAVGNRAQPPTDSDGQRLRFTTDWVPTAIRGQAFRHTFMVEDPDGTATGAFTAGPGRLPAGLRAVFPPSRPGMPPPTTGPTAVLTITGTVGRRAQSSTIAIRFTDSANPNRQVTKTFLFRVEDGPRCEPPPANVDWFYPARWAREGTCRDNQSAPVTLTMAVGSVDSRLLPGMLSQRNPEPNLVAPGEFVYLPPDAGFSDDIAPPAPAGEGASYTPDFSFPRFISGTSVATAFVSAIAAQAQGLRVARNEAPYDADELEQRMMANARFIPVLVQGTRQAYIPSWARLKDAIVGGNDLNPAPVDQTGLRQLSDYEVTLLSGQSPVMVRPTELVPLDEARNYQLEDASAMVGAPKLGPDQYEAGSVGPLPTGPVCPSCFEKRLPGTDLVRLDLDLSPELAGVMIDDPVLVIEDTQSGKQYAVTLSGDDSWAPGMHLQLIVEFPADDPNLTYDQTKMALGAVLDEDGVITFDMSVLERQFE